MEIEKVEFRTSSRMKLIKDNHGAYEDEFLKKFPQKRSFDVAFLMLPDDKLKERELEISAHQMNRSGIATDKQIVNELVTKSKNLTRISTLKTDEDIYRSGSFNSSTSSEKNDDVMESESPRSAFSKVSQVLNVDPPTTDGLNFSPISCPSSAAFQMTYNQCNSNIFQTAVPCGIPTIGKYKHLISRDVPGRITNRNCDQTHYRFGVSSTPLISQQEQFIRNPAAAILSTFLPSTLGALSMPAQNVCAKCNISFRMTSDLVFHMRSHHKNENSQDSNRRKREEKLRCSVCSESFRERHHLTRHMSAHY